MRAIATLVCVFGILVLFRLNRDRRAKTSTALWLPVLWLGINASRSVTEWMASFGLGSRGGRGLGQSVEGSPVDASVFTALMALGIFALVQRRTKVVPILRANAPVLAFFAYCALSAAWSDMPGVTITRWVKAMGDITMVLIVLTEHDRQVAVRQLLLRVGFVLVPFSILFIKYYGELGRTYSPGGLVNYVGVTTNKNLLGLMTLIFGLGCVWSLLLILRQKETREKGPLLARGLLLVMIVWLFVMANSATSMSCFFIATGLILVTSTNRVGKSPLLRHLLVVAAISFSLFALFVAPTLLTTVGRDSTLTGRTEIWNQVLAVAGSPWVGTGFESFWLGKRQEALWDLYYFHLNEAHNGYIEIFITLGWLGIGLFAVVLLSSYRNIFSAFRREPNLARLSLAYFVVALVYNCTESAYRMGNPIWIMLFLAGMAVPTKLGARVTSSLRSAEPIRIAVAEPKNNELSVGHKDLF